MDARFRTPLPVLGLHGQLLGHVQEVELDLATGRLHRVVLQTDWQPIALSWERLEYDAGGSALRIRAAPAPS